MPNTLNAQAERTVTEKATIETIIWHIPRGSRGDIPKDVSTGTCQRERYRKVVHVPEEADICLL